MLAHIKVYSRAGDAEMVIRTSPIHRSALNLIVKLPQKGDFNIKEKSSAPTSLHGELLNGGA
jgi:hypothetical protein